MDYEIAQFYRALTNAINNQAQAEYTIAAIIILLLLAIQNIINLFVIIDFIRSKQNTKILIASVLITMLAFEIYAIIQQR